MEFKEFTVADDVYLEALDLREKHLRLPIGLKLGPEDTSDDLSQFHFGILDEAKLIACVSLNPTGSEIVQLRQMVVTPNHQGKGVGAHLITSMEQEIGSKGFRRIEMEARVSAVPFYQKQGYGTHGAVYSHLGIDHLKMGKSIGTVISVRRGPASEVAMNRRKRMQFWGENEDDDSLVLEIERGEKTATVCKADEYELSEGDYDDGNWQIGDLVEVYDLKKNRRCLIEITEVYLTTWSNIPEKLWRGEACRSEKHFKDAHLYCWPEYDIDEHFEMMATHFRLIEVFEG